MTEPIPSSCTTSWRAQRTRPSSSWAAPSAPRSPCGPIRCRRCARASACCATTTAGTDARRPHQGPTRSMTSAGTCSPCSTGWGSSASPTAGSRSAVWSACGSAASARSASSSWCSAAPRPYLGPPDRWQERIELVRTKRGMDALVDAMIVRGFSAGAAPPAPRWSRVPAGMLRGHIRRGLCRMLRGDRRDMDLRRRLKSITAPTLVIAGAEDPATPPAMAGHPRLDPRLALRGAPGLRPPRQRWSSPSGSRRRSSITSRRSRPD